ncbi:hypothetical protein V494_00348 [Pseudogymnoascus sp. VKM F-4513 (FW-928)]|nr:hypothetical protein V494_00348 [Pseudogymnoascus sp. VKM F-4513 (FW-928)]
MSQRPLKVLLFALSEYGNFNPSLAAAHELVTRGCEVHVSSFDEGHDNGSGPRARIFQLNNGDNGPITTSTSTPALPAKFHAISGYSMGTGFAKHPDGGSFQDFQSRPPNSIFLPLPGLGTLMCWMTPAEYKEAVESCVKILKDVEPDIICMDPWFSSPKDACELMGRNFVVLSQNTAQETIDSIQPMGGVLWKYPMLGTGLPYPLPLHLIPSNMATVFRYVYRLNTAPEICATNAVRKSLGNKKEFPGLVKWEKDNHYLIPCPTEADFEWGYIPENVTFTGPVLVKGTGLGGDPELLTWLQKAGKGNTVLINLGSNTKYTQANAVEMATAIFRFLEAPAGQDRQVLWKMTPKPSGENETRKAILRILGNLCNSGRARVEKWFTVEPGDILRGGYCGAMVHHGGANTYFEVLGAGIPHVICPAWFDLYTMAARVEYLNIGFYASKASAPNLNATEIADGLITALDMNPDNIKGEEMRQNALRLGEVTRAYGGVKAAVDKIVELAKEKNFQRP